MKLLILLALSLTGCVLDDQRDPTEQGQMPVKTDSGYYYPLNDSAK